LEIVNSFLDEHSREQVTIAIRIIMHGAVPAIVDLLVIVPAIVGLLVIVEKVLPSELFYCNTLPTILIYDTIVIYDTIDIDLKHQWQ
jgi:hypothetical protein